MPSSSKLSSSSSSSSSSSTPPTPALRPLVHGEGAAAQLRRRHHGSSIDDDDDDDDGGGGHKRTGLSVAFVHPDLGIGGAERLVVDAAVALQQRGHTVDVYTTHCSRAHSFPETHDGTLSVRVHFDWLPRTLFGIGHLVCVAVRVLLLALVVCLAARRYDVVFVDQLALPVPLLRRVGRVPVFFYCHFPDKLLVRGREHASALRRAYRAPLDWLDDDDDDDSGGGGQRSDVDNDVARQQRRDDRRPALFVSLNRFERKKGLDIAVRAFARFVDRRRRPRRPARLASSPSTSFSNTTSSSAGAALSLSSRARLVIAGGYDERVDENVEYEQELRALVRELGLRSCVVDSANRLLHVDDALDDDVDVDDRDAAAAAAAAAAVTDDDDDDDDPLVAAAALVDVVFARSISEATKRSLLTCATAVLYTPENEHFGIVPLEAMYARRPVVALASGGPRESVVDGVTGVLAAPDDAVAQFADALTTLDADRPRARSLGDAGRRRVAECFSRDVMGQQFERVLYGARQRWVERAL